MEEQMPNFNEVQVKMSPGSVTTNSEERAVEHTLPINDHAKKTSPGSVPTNSGEDALWCPPSRPKVKKTSSVSAPTASAKDPLEQTPPRARPRRTENSGSEADSDDEDEDGDLSQAVNLAVNRLMRMNMYDDDDKMDCEQLPARESLGGVSGSENVAESLALGQVDAREVFSWSEDFSTFSGKEETYLRTPGPTVETQDAVTTFLHVWDKEIMGLIVRETNKYAWQTIVALTETESGIPKYLSTWDETTVEEMYRYFAVIILMSMCYRPNIKDYYTTGIMEMPEFRTIMPRNRFQLLTKFLHFQDNDCVDCMLSHYDKKVIKIRPILDHCNRKFSSLYVPAKHLSLDESLLLWKGRLSWAQCTRTKAVRFGIKSYELCEAATGYQLKCLVYAGKGAIMTEESVHGFDNCTDKVVLELMDGYLNVGHTLVMDNFYNRLSLIRFLKRNRTDVIGTINRRRNNMPNDIKYANDKQMSRGDVISRHCGDISVVAWKDVKFVTAVSTYHPNKMLPGRRATEDRLKPAIILDYKKYMGGVDQKLSMYLLERNRGKKWYMKVFRRLLNTSLMNTYILHTRNPSLKTVSHRDFRWSVALGLLDRFQLANPSPWSAVPLIRQRVKETRLSPGQHFPCGIGKIEGSNRKIQKRCVRCTAAGRRTMVTRLCKLCNVPLCDDECWTEYHTFKNL